MLLCVDDARGHDRGTNTYSCGRDTDGRHNDHGWKQHESHDKKRNAFRQSLVGGLDETIGETVATLGEWPG
jgi:hypothetical protein